MANLDFEVAVREAERISRISAGDRAREALLKTLEEQVKGLSVENRVRVLSIIYPFSLMCSECDAGTECGTYDAALQVGWRHIDFDDGMSWYFLGVCPDCYPSWSS